MDVILQLGQEVLARFTEDPNLILGLVVTLIMFFGGHQGKQDLEAKARTAIEAAEHQLDKAGTEKLDAALDVLIGLVPAQFRPFVSLAKPLIRMLIQQTFDKEFGHLKKTEQQKLQETLQAESDKATAAGIVSVADSMLELKDAESKLPDSLK